MLMPCWLLPVDAAIKCANTQGRGLLAKKGEREI